MIFFPVTAGRAISLAACILLLSLLAGCALAVGTAAVGVGAAGAAGYTVYKAGEGVVDTVVPGDSSKPAEQPAESQPAWAKEATETFPKPKPKPKPSTAVVYYHNEFKAQLDSRVATVFATANSTLPRMAIVITSHTLNKTNGEIYAQTIEDVPIYLTMQSTGPDSTVLKIRVGASGDLKYSESIYNLIKDDLGKSASPAQPAGGQEL